jgi:hypothetical protein
MSYDVLASGKFQERDVLLRFDVEVDNHEEEKYRFGVPPSAQIQSITLPAPSTSGRITEQGPF